MPQATDHTAPPGPERRRVDDLNARIHEAMTFTGTLTSQQLFELCGRPLHHFGDHFSRISHAFLTQRQTTPFSALYHSTRAVCCNLSASCSCSLYVDWCLRADADWCLQSDVCLFPFS